MFRSRIALIAPPTLVLLALAVAPALAACTPSSVRFIAGTAVSTGAAPACCISADFDRDGRLDLAVASYAISGGIEVMRGGGTGRFGPASDIAPGERSFGLAVADFDSDGQLDLAATNLEANTVSVYIGHGDGTFTRTQVLTMGAAPHHLAAGDLNHDGVPDLATANNTTSTVTVRLGTGGGAFGPPQAFAIANLGTDIAIADVDEDGNPDLIAPEFTSGTVAVLHGLGDGTFASATHIDAGGGAPYCVTLTDANRDGHLDLFVGKQANGGCVRLLGIGDGTFGAAVPIGTDAVGQLLVEDFDGDGIRDVVFTQVTSNRVSFLRGTVNGTYLYSQSLTTGNYPLKMAGGDFDGNGLPDFAAMNFNESIASVFLAICDPNTPGYLIESVRDVPADQGGRVRVQWTKHPQDVGGGTVSGYTIFRRLGAADWEVAGTVNALRTSHYSFIATTAQDSVAGSNPYTSFYVRANNSTGVEYYFDTPPDSGYSVDNLAPHLPWDVVATFDGTATTLDWSANTERDIAGYRVHRGASADFVPASDNLIGSPSTPHVVDPFGALAWYKLAAVDVHGNVSEYASVYPQYPTPVDASLASWRVTPNGVELEWLVDVRGVTSATLERGDGAGTWTIVASGTPDPNGRLVLADDGVAPGTTVLYRLAFTTSEGTFHSAPSTIALPALALALEGARPNPAASATLALAFTLRTGASASLELYDVAGRRVLAREVGAFGPGRHVLDLRDAHLAGGVYLARLTQGGEQRQARIVVL